MTGNSDSLLSIRKTVCAIKRRLFLQKAQV